MKRLSVSAFLAMVFISIVPLRASNDDYYYKINKSFEIFGAVFRELANNYVVNVDPEVLMEDGINGMLSTLDPYTVYMDADETDDIDFITSGTYIGLGITVAYRDSMLTIIGIRDGYSAQQQGLRIGDRIYKVDTSVVINITSDDLRKYTKGPAGTSVDMWIIRDGRNDTLKYILQRQEIKVNNVSFFGIVRDSLAYIKLDRFSRTSAEEVRNSLNELNRQNPNIKGVILDLRDNPGGLLESAVSICEIFVPPNSVIVTTKGRNPDADHVYRSVLTPMEPNVPLAVLINGNSASASEIVAGAIQDLDRGVIVGQKSFGKGLVQSVFDMPYKANLKITTAKYFTPSGRCIHKLRVQPGQQSVLSGNFHHDSIYYTLNKRPVVESMGIIPDSVVKNGAPYSEYINSLMRSDLMFMFVNKYIAGMDSLHRDFEVSMTLMNDFRNYLSKNNFDYETGLQKDISGLQELASKESLSDRTLKEISKLAKTIKKEEKDPFEINSSDIKDLLYDEIYSRFNSEKNMIDKSLKDDNYVSLAADLLKPGIYSRILSGSTADNPTKKNNEH